LGKTNIAGKRGMGIALALALARGIKLSNTKKIMRGG
jgi:hypothetical protein